MLVKVVTLVYEVNDDDSLSVMMARGHVKVTNKFEANEVNSLSNTYQAIQGSSLKPCVISFLLEIYILRSLSLLLITTYLIMISHSHLHNDTTKRKKSYRRRSKSSKSSKCICGSM